MISLPFRKAATATLEEGAAFRDLYTRVLLGLRREERLVLGVTSAIAGEGKSIIAAGLATTLAQEEAGIGSRLRAGQILLIECNRGTRTDDPSLTVSPGPGLLQCLRGDCTVEAAIRQTDYEGLSILPLGEPASSFPLLIRNAAFAEVLQELRARYDFIILDLPALLEGTDAQVLAGFADRVLMVVRAGVTPSKLVSQALAEIPEAQFLGVVLNDSRPDLPAWLDQRL